MAEKQTQEQTQPPSPSAARKEPPHLCHSFWGASPLVQSWQEGQCQLNSSKIIKMSNKHYLDEYELLRWLHLVFWWPLEPRHRCSTTALQQRSCTETGQPQGLCPSSHQGPTSTPRRTGSALLSSRTFTSPVAPTTVHSLAPEIHSLPHTRSPQTLTDPPPW